MVLFRRRLRTASLLTTMGGTFAMLTLTLIAACGLPAPTASQEPPISLNRLSINPGLTLTQAPTSTAIRVTIVPVQITRQPLPPNYTPQPITPRIPPTHPPDFPTSASTGNVPYLTPMATIEIGGLPTLIPSIPVATSGRVITVVVHTTPIATGIPLLAVTPHPSTTKPPTPYRVFPTVPWMGIYTPIPPTRDPRFIPTEPPPIVPSNITPITANPSLIVTVTPAYYVTRFPTSSPAPTVSGPRSGTVDPNHTPPATSLPLHRPGILPTRLRPDIQTPIPPPVTLEYAPTRLPFTPVP